MNVSLEKLKANTEGNSTHQLEHRYTSGDEHRSNSNLMGNLETCTEKLTSPIEIKEKKMFE